MKVYVIFLFKLIIFRCLGQEGLKSFFSEDFQKYLENGNKHETCFCNVFARHNSVRVIQKWF